MSARMVDRIGLRFGAGLSAVVLLAAFAFDLAVLVPIVGVALLVGAVFGPAASPMSLLYRALRATVLRRVRPDPEPAAPPRFAMTLGAFVLAAASLAFFVYEARAVGWGFTLAVAALQVLLAGAGICVGCEIYLLLKRLQTPRSGRGVA